jgi:Ca2+-binding EF-hand superfamily protein
MKGIVVVTGVLSFLVLSGVVGAATPDTKSEFRQLDADKDGKVSLEEYTKKLGDKQKKSAEARFKKADKNKDGFLVLDEFKKARQNRTADTNKKGLKKAKRGLK